MIWMVFHGILDGVLAYFAGRFLMERWFARRLKRAVVESAARRLGWEEVKRKWRNRSR